MKKIQSMIILFLIVCVSMPVHIFAQEISQEKTGNLQISYICSDTTFRVYKVADISGTGSYITTDEFSKYQVELNGKDKDAMRDAAETLAAYVRRDQLASYCHGTTDKQGNLTFSDLKRGLYLVIGEEHKEKGNIYTAMPFFAEIPARDENGQITYTIKAVPKYEKKPEIEKKSDYQVTKIWKDEGHGKNRPKTIVVQLLKDGEIYDEVTLNEKNNWQHTWKDLSEKNEWEVTEEVRGAYTVSVAKEGTSFIITNTYKNQHINKPTTSTNTITTTSRGIKTTTARTTAEYKRQNTTRKKLPQTGQLWWPVPVLTVSGILCILIGMVRRRDSEDEK